MDVDATERRDIQKRLRQELTVGDHENQIRFTVVDQFDGRRLAHLERLMHGQPQFFGDNLDGRG